MSRKSSLLLEHRLKELRLPSFLREYGEIEAQCTAEDVDHPEYLLRLAELEPIDRHQRMVERPIRAARFPAVKSLDTLDFPAIPSVNKALVMELARCEYIQRRENVTAVGNGDDGKTHVVLGLAAYRHRMSVGLHRRLRPGPRADGGQRDDRPLLNPKARTAELVLQTFQQLGNLIGVVHVGLPLADHTVFVDDNCGPFPI